MLISRAQWKGVAAGKPLNDIMIGGQKLSWEVSANFNSTDFSLVNDCGEVMGRSELPTDAVLQAKYRLLPYASEISPDEFESIAILIPVRFKRAAEGERVVIDPHHLLSGGKHSQLQGEGLRVFDLPERKSKLGRNAYSVKFVSSALAAFHGGEDGIQVLHGGGARPIILFNTALASDLTQQEVIDAAFNLYVDPPEWRAHDTETVAPTPAMTM